MNKTLKYEDIKDNSATDLLKIVKFDSIISFDDMHELIYTQILNNCILLNDKNLPEINYINLEIIKRYSIIFNFTNIEIPESMESKFSIELANWSNKIWDKCIKRIKNYELFEKLLDKAINDELNNITNIERKIHELIDELIIKIKNINIKETLSGIDPKLISKFSDVLSKIQNKEVK